MSDVDDEEGEEEEVANLGTYGGERNEKEERHGMGKAVLPNGDIYQGQYVAGKREGIGAYIFKKSNARYIGAYKNGKKSGEGTMLYPDGTKYEGTWLNNRRQGFGKYSYKNGDTYEGNWTRNKQDGLGTYTYAPVVGKNAFASHKLPIQYSGTWKDGIRHGHGEFLAPHIKYRGKYKFDEKRGLGKFVFHHNGCQLRGEYVPHVAEEEDEPDEDEEATSHAKFQILSDFEPCSNSLEQWEIDEMNKFIIHPPSVPPPGGFPEEEGPQKVSSYIDYFMTDAPQRSKCVKSVMRESLLDEHKTVMDVPTKEVHQMTGHPSLEGEEEEEEEEEEGDDSDVSEHKPKVPTPSLESVSKSSKSSK